MRATHAPRLAARLASSQMDGLTAWLPSGASRECRRVSARPTRRNRPPARHRAATFRAREADGITWELELGDTIGSGQDRIGVGRGREMSDERASAQFTSSSNLSNSNQLQRLYMPAQY